MDCTSRRHVEVNFDERRNVFIVKHVGSTVTYQGSRYGERELSMLEVPPGREVMLWLGGLYSKSGVRVPVVIRFGGSTRYPGSKERARGSETRPTRFF